MNKFCILGLILFPHPHCFRGLKLKVVACNSVCSALLYLAECCTLFLCLHFAALKVQECAQSNIEEVIGLLGGLEESSVNSNEAGKLISNSISTCCDFV